jgi:hypothetical protein
MLGILESLSCGLDINKTIRLGTKRNSNDGAHNSHDVISARG